MTTERYTLDLASVAPVPGGGQTQLYRNMPTDAVLVGFVAESDVSVVRVVVGASVLTLAEGKTWDDVLGKGLSVPKSQYVTLSVRNDGKNEKTLRASLLLQGQKPAGVESEAPKVVLTNDPFGRPEAGSSGVQGAGPMRASPPLPRSPVPPNPRKAIAPDASVTVVLQTRHASMLLAYVDKNRRPMPEDVTFILGRLDAAVRSAESGSKGTARSWEVQIAMTAGDVFGLSMALRRGGAAPDTVRAAVRKALLGEPKEPERATADISHVPSTEGFDEGMHAGLLAALQLAESAKSLEECLELLREAKRELEPKSETVKLEEAPS